MTMNPPEDFLGVFVEVFFIVDLDFLGMECPGLFFDDDTFADLEGTREDLLTDKEVKGSADGFLDEDFCDFVRTLFSFLSKYSIAEDFLGGDRS